MIKTIAVVFAALVALGASVPNAQAASKTGGTTLHRESGLSARDARVDLRHADAFSSRHRGWHGHRGGHRHGWHGGARRWHGGWHGHRRWVAPRHHWRPYRHWGARGYGWRGYGWHQRHRHCWRVWRHGRPVVVCGWRRW